MGMADDDGDDAVPHFDSPEAELHFWKNRAGNLQTTLRETDATLKEFAESSRELEKEMERELSAATNKASDLQVKAERLKGDVDEWKSKYQRALTEHNKSLAELNRELSTLRESHNVYKNKLRDMELDNDELENAERMVASSLHDMESRYNRAIERTALLEEELVEKTRLEEENQRLKDELQEVSEEAAVLRDRLEAGRSAVAHSIDDSFSTQRPVSQLSDRPATLRGSQASSVGRAGITSHSTSPRTKASMSRQAVQARASASDVRSVSRAGVSNSSPKSSSTGMPSSPSANALRARQSMTARPTIARTRVTGTGSTSARTQGGSMQKMAGLLRNLRELQATVQSATRMTADIPSAIPRPSSRMSSSHAHVSATPRRSAYGREDVMSPSSIPVPSTGLSRSTSILRPPSRAGMSERPRSRLGTSDRPPSRLSANDRPPSRFGMSERPSSRLSTSDRHHISPSLRSQTPSNFEHANLEFLEHDPAKLKRRSQQAALGSSSMANVPSTSSTSAAHVHDREIGNRSVDHSARPRGASVAGTIRDHHYSAASTLSAASGAHASSRMRGEREVASEGNNPMSNSSSSSSSTMSALHSLRKSAHPRTGKPVPPPSSSVMRYASLSRHRSTASMDSGRAQPGSLGPSGSQSVDV